MPSIHQKMNTRTRALIRDTFIESIAERGFDKVTIRQVVEKAGINRGTFYLHYSDKYELIAHIQSELLEGFREVLVVGIDFEDTYRHHFEKKPYPQFTAIFAYFVRHAELFELLSGTKGEAGFPAKLKKTVVQSFHRKLDNSRVFARHPSVPADYFTAYTASLLLGIMEAWLEREPRESAEELALIYNEMMTMQRILR